MNILPLRQRMIYKYGIQAQGDASQLSRLMQQLRVLSTTHCNGRRMGDAFSQRAQTLIRIYWSGRHTPSNRLAIPGRATVPASATLLLIPLALLSLPHLMTKTFAFGSFWIGRLLLYLSTPIKYSASLSPSIASTSSVEVMMVKS